MLSERELESRYEVFVEQYATKLNIEAETAASIARTMILPAAVRHLAELRGRRASTALVGEVERAGRASSYDAILALEEANAEPPGRARASSTPSTCATR